MKFLRIKLRIKFLQAFLFSLCMAHGSILGAEENRAIGFEEAGRLAAAASAELKDGRARRALREGAWTLGFRAYLPQLTLQASEDERLSSTSSDSFTKTWTLGLEELVFDGGRTRTARKIERASLALLAGELKQTEAAVMENAVSAYRKILLSRMIVSIRRDALASLGEQRRIMEEELALGLVIPLDLVQAEITVREAELELEALTLQLEEDERLFTEILGMDSMPVLGETVDTGRSAALPETELVVRTALGRNPGISRAALSIMQKEIEAKLASRSWIPTVKATGNFSLSGQRYPLTRSSWSLGFSVQFSSPWFNASTGGSAGMEGRHDKTARLHQSVSPLPDPAAGLGAKQAELALALEQENFRRNLREIERQAVLAVKNLSMSEERRRLAMAALELAGEKWRLGEVLLGLGKITRLKLMEERLEYAAKEAAAAEAAAALLETERALERLMDLPPGSLENFIRRTERHKELP